MQKKLTITIDERVYEGLHSVIGKRKISQFIEKLVKPYVVGKDLEEAYEKMAKDESREQEATEWIEAMIGDIVNEAR
jgi:predicted CopG family antitoxin